jgi:hypothetical protein
LVTCIGRSTCGKTEETFSKYISDVESGKADYTQFNVNS